MAAKVKRKKKTMTLEGLAGAIQRDLGRMATRDDLKGLATKEDLGQLRAEVATKEEMGNLRDDLATRISLAKEELSEQIAGLKYAKEIDELRARVVRVEQKLGIKQASAA